MELAVIIVLIVLAAAFVAMPFLQSEESLPPAAAPAFGTARSDAERHKSEAYAVIKEAEFDLEMGKLSEADFQALRSKYAAQALTAMAALEGDVASAPIARRVQRGRLAYCPACGHSVPERANFCAGCGKDLKKLAA